jgi:hypothetical protein
VSLVRLPETLPRLDVTAAADAEGQWRLAVSERAGRPVTLSHVVWDAEQTQPSATGNTPHVALTSERLSTLFDAAVVPPGGVLQSRAWSFAGLPAGPIRVRVAGIDARGRRVAAWATIDPSRAHLRLAALP